MSWYEKVVLIIAAIGAINWGLAEFGWNLVELIVGDFNAMIATIIYYIIGICGIWAIVKAVK